MTNLGQHSLDIVHWCLGLEVPAAVTSAGGRFSLSDNGETPDAQDALLEYPGCVANWSHREGGAGAGAAPPTRSSSGPAGKPGDLTQGVRRHARPPPGSRERRAPVRWAHPIGGPTRTSGAEPGVPPLDRGGQRQFRATSTTSSAAMHATSSTASSRGARRSPTSRAVTES